MERSEAEMIQRLLDESSAENRDFLEHLVGEVMLRRRQHEEAAASCSTRQLLDVLAEEAVRLQRADQLDGERRASDCGDADDVTAAENRRRAEVDQFEDVGDEVQFRRTGNSRSGVGSTADGLDMEANRTVGDRSHRNGLRRDPNPTVGSRYSEHQSRTERRAVEHHLRSRRHQQGEYETVSEVSSMSRSPPRTR